MHGGQSQSGIRIYVQTMIYSILFWSLVTDNIDFWIAPIKPQIVYWFWSLEGKFIQVSLIELSPPYPCLSKSKSTSCTSYLSRSGVWKSKDSRICRNLERKFIVHTVWRSASNSRSFNVSVLLDNHSVMLQPRYEIHFEDSERTWSTYTPCLRIGLRYIASSWKNYSSFSYNF